ncbi:MAG: OmpA family protein [Wenzhouxiangellaceae bacterium]|nr:OmpA family protein [Wenzhouxiangellaceae bacterium]
MTREPPNKPAGIAAAAALVLAATAPTAAWPQSDPGTSDRSQSTGQPEPAGNDELFDRSMRELFDTSNAISDKAGADEPVTFSGDDQPRWLQGLTVTKSDNPMLESRCREQALAANTERLQAEGGYGPDAETLQATMEHMEMHHAFIRDNRISYGEYLKTLAQCTEFCAPLVASLMQCHVLSVARRPHGIVLFELDSSRVDERFRGGVIDEMAAEYEAADDARILVIGRASQIGNLEYNRRLAAQRALAVRDELTGRGVPFDRIRPIWFGWEPPQIDEMIAAEYGISDLMTQYGETGVNQSVVMVIF